MKLLTCYTPSHKVFLPQFLDSLDQTNLDVTIRMHKQECETGEFASDGWNQTTKRKFEFLLEEMWKEDGREDIMIFSDIDIQFFAPPQLFATKALQASVDDIGLDMVFQNDYYGHACTGFFYFRNNNKVRDFIEQAITEIPKWRDDQEAVNKMLEAQRGTTGKNKLYYALLPEEFFTFGSFYKHWEGETNFPIPDRIVMHHANWVKGVKQKLELLRVVRSIYDERSKLQAR